jgi:lipopolysaccharide export system permease protein
MTQLDHYITKKFVGTWLRTVLSLIGLYILIDFMTDIRVEVLEQDIPLVVVAHYYVLILPRLISEYQFAALAVLVAALIVLGRLAQRNELTAMLAGGIGLKRIVAGPVLASLCISLLMFAFSETLAPRAARNVDEIEVRYFGKGRDGMFATRAGVLWADLPDGWKCDIRKFNRAALTGEDVLMYSEKPDRHEQITAKRIFWQEADQKWILEDGAWAVFFPNDAMRRVSRRITQESAPFDALPDVLMTQYVKTDTLSAAELNVLRKKHAASSRTGRRLSVDFFGRFSEPLLPFIIVWLAIPFSVRLGRGSRTMGFVITLAIGLSYLFFYSVTQTLGYAGQIPPWAAAALANALFLCAGVLLFIRTPT